MSLAAEGTMLASGGSDSTLRLWDKHTGQQLRIVYGHSRSVLSMEIGECTFFYLVSDVGQICCFRCWTQGILSRR